MDHQERWDERHAAHDPIESPEADASLAALARRLTPGRALDLATGDGRNAIWLAANGWQVTAVDFSRVALARARASAAVVGVEVAWVQADLLEWVPAASSFDLVAVVYLHLPSAERRAVYARAAAAVAPGGRLVVVGHDRTNLERGTGGPQDPDVLFTADEIAADLDGLLTETASVVVRDVGDGRQALDALLVAVRPPG
jgi:SAM-dependent methyltransferase